MNFIIIALSIIIIFLLFLIYRFAMSGKTPLVTNISLKSGHPDVALSKLKIKDYGTYNIEFWIYVNELPTTLSFSNNNYYGKFNILNNSNGCILQTSDANLSLDLYSNNVFTFYNGRNKPAVAPVSTKAAVQASAVGVTPVVQASPAVAAVPAVPGEAYPSALTKNFPVQKWTYVVVSVQNNSLVDLFINGKLVQSSNYNGTDTIDKIQKPSSDKSLQFGKNLNALITKLYINPVAMNTTTAWNNYLAGNGSSVSKTNISFNLTQDGKISNKINIL